MFILKGTDVILLDFNDLSEWDLGDTLAFGALVLRNSDEELVEVDRDEPLQELSHVCRVC